MDNCRIGVVYNPIAGRGRGAFAAESLIAPLERAGFQPVLQPAIDLATEDARASFLSSIDRLVLVGGDGTVRHYLEAVSRAAIPIWNYPAGNECLFARRFGMKPGAEPLIAALRGGRTEEHHFGRVGGAPFFLMASAGLDAAVIHRLHRGRSGGVTWVNYILPTAAEMLYYKSPEISVVVDGKKTVDAARGLFIAANTKEYAWGIDPVTEADSLSDLLHCRFFPDDGVRFYLGRLTSALLNRSAAIPGELRFQGRAITVTSRQPNVLVQADGEPAGCLPAEITVAKEKLVVLRGGV